VPSHLNQHLETIAAPSTADVLAMKIKGETGPLFFNFQLETRKLNQQ
jgi:hypothetical protein